MRCLTTYAFLCMLLCGPAHAQNPAPSDILVADFEGETYGRWKTTGEAFGTAPAQGTLGGQMNVSGFAGKGLVNSFLNGDGTTGTLTSPSIKVERQYLTFLIGGGGYAGTTCMNLLVDGQVSRTVAGTNTQPGGNEALEPAFWDVSDLLGKTITLQIVDDATGGWGHINVDHIVQTNTKPKLPDFARREKSFTVESRYLIIPIQDQANIPANIGNQEKPTGQIQLFAGDEEVRRYDLSIAQNANDAGWYAFFDISAYQGKAARVVASRVTQEGFELIEPSNQIPGAEDFYQERHRPQFHFTQKVGWINDPNGMVYYDGTWHFFFQHNPVSLQWGNMTWGHATSKDLLHWEQQPNKLFPNTMARGACFSGGATVDTNDTAGWGKNTLVAFLTDTGAGESVAYSTDGGKSFTMYEGNPVIKHNGRDPKVIWYAYDNTDKPLNESAKKLGGHWVMVVYDEHPEYQRNAAFYTSTNLKEWTEQSHLPGYFECTELFELPVDGDTQNRRWIVFAADARYALGTFDGKVFTPEHEGKHQVHWGRYYASQTFDNAPGGRRIQMGWLQVPSPGTYNQHFSFPHELTLRTTEDGIRMFAKPIEEIEQLRVKSNEAKPRDLNAGKPVTLPVSSDLLDVRLTFEVGTATSIEVKLPGRTIKYDAKTQKLNEASLKPVDRRVSIQVLADRSLTEIIGNDGRVFISGDGPAKIDSSEVSVTAIGGDAKLVSLEAHELKSIWE